MASLRLGHRPSHFRSHNVLAAPHRQVGLVQLALYASSTAIMPGFQIIYSAFFVSILEIRASRPTEGTVADHSAEAA